jgi:hypothetical protein
MATRNRSSKDENPITRPLSLKKMSDISWRIFRIMAEFIDGFQFISTIKKGISVFGSARLSPDNIWSKEAEKLGELLQKEGFEVSTGGGPGIMEAANRGAYKVNPNHSIGFNIELPKEQRINPYVGRAIGFYHFFTRKVMLSASGRAYVFFPGGFGTIDEFSEILTLVQTKKMVATPIVLVGKGFWQPLVDWFQKYMAEDLRTINPADLKLFHIVDSAEEAMKYIRKAKERTIF